MTRSNGCLQHSRIAVAVALLAGLAACGGGGGGPEGLMTISTANQDAVAHATGTLMGTMGVTGAVPLSVSPGRALALSARRAASSGRVGFSDWVAWLPARVVVAAIAESRAGAAAAANRERVLAFHDLGSAPCLVSGSVKMSFDDRNENNTVDTGDVISMDFNACMVSASETVNGHADATIAAISDTSMTMNFAFSNMASASTNHSLALNGTMVFDISGVDPTGTTYSQMSLTARDAVTLTAHTHGFEDVVTMRSGFVMTERPGAGGTTLTTASGRFESTTAGGAADMSTLTEMTSDCTCSYPTAGAVRIAGKLGKLSITAAGDMVRMDLDDDNDNETEATKSASWDWLY